MSSVSNFPFDMSTQVVFKAIGDDTGCGGGIAFGYNIICGCCGGVIESDDVEFVRELPWINISEEILGN